MFFALLVLFSSLLIEVIGTYVSIVGLSALFAANPVIITLAMALDLGKIVCVSFLYRYWTKINLLMKSYMLVASAILIIITSAGAFGYLSSQFQKAISSTNESNILIASLTDEQNKLQKRKEDIDTQIKNLPENSVRGRTALIKQFGPEVERINARIVEIDAELPKLKIESVKKNVEVGPIIFIAEAFDSTPEKAVKWVIMIIIFVFDPLAIVLLIAGNYLLDLRKKELNKIPHFKPAISESKPAISESTTQQQIKQFSVPNDVNTAFAEKKDEYSGVIVKAVEPEVKPKEIPPEKEVREVITLNQLQQKYHRSSLEDVSSNSDVIQEENQIADRNLVKSYSS